MKRTHLPLNGLRVLDAAARHLSFTRAADELAVTPAAVGQQIRALEDLLGVVLFRRTPKGLELTDEASSGLDAVREGFLRFEEGVQAIQAGQSSHVYTIACPRDFFAAWLSPRLAAFRAGNEHMRFALVGGDGDADFTEANLDLAVRWAEGPGELEGLPLGTTDLVTVAAPGAGEDAPWIGWPGDSCPDGQGVEAGFSVGDAGTAISAAVAGLGKARVPALLAQASLANGSVIAVGTGCAGRRSYWLVAPLPQWRQKKVKLLVAALTE
ncbi:LysR family transcriptional regulator [Novosphingobium lentum]|uniref:LysR family transcriptional regulator n=1 Tax=Novosphingobium lentum TaxID=145287 RepID=UPI0008352532|nr:LysR family transcriptional regulator [Novosphingobium lentum]